MTYLVTSNDVNTISLIRPLYLNANEQQGSISVDQYNRTFWIQIPSDRGGTLRVGFWTLIAEDPIHKIGLVCPDKPDMNEPMAVTNLITKTIVAGNRGKGHIYIVVQAAKVPYNIFATFTESAFATNPNGTPFIPWNFWYFPTSRKKELREQSVFGKTLRPIQKFERAFGIDGMMAWEKGFHGDFDGTDKDFEGHCDFAAAGSIVFDPPPQAGVTYNGIHFTCEELKYLIAEYMGSHFQPAGTDYVLPGSDVEDGVDARKDPLVHALTMQALSEEPALFGWHPNALPALLRMLRLELGVWKRAVMMDLRADPKSVGKREDLAAERWNYAVYKYVIEYNQDPKEDPRRVSGLLTLFANGDRYDGAESSGFPAFVHNGRPVPVTEDMPRMNPDTPHAPGAPKPAGALDDVFLRGEIRAYRFVFTFTKRGDIEEKDPTARWKGHVFPPRYAARPEPLPGPMPEDTHPRERGNPYVELSHLTALGLRQRPIW